MESQKYFKFREDVSQAPLRMLRQTTKQSIALKLDSRKLLLTKTGLHRDWRGLAEKVNLDSSVIKSSKISYTEHCFHLWIQQAPATIIRELWNALDCIDRFDVIEDTLTFIYNDYDYAMSKDVLGLRPILPSLEENQTSIAEFDSNVLTTDDQRNLTDGGSLQFYDALILFADEDLDFVDQMVQKLEGEYNLKLCLKDRDLVGGLAFELSAVLRLIEERCARVIVVLSPEFLQSNVNKFFTQFAHALSIDQQRRILIPCMYKFCKKPTEISYCHSLDYFRTNGYWDYWKKLAESIVYKNPMPRSGAVVREVTTSSPSLPSSIAASSTLPALPCSSVSSSVTSSGFLSRIRRRTGDQADKKKSKTKEVSTQDSKSSEKILEDTVSLNSGLYINLNKTPHDTGDLDNRSTCSYESRSPTASTFSAAPLLSSSHKGGTLRNMLKKVTKFKKKKESAH